MHKKNLFGKRFTYFIEKVLQKISGLREKFNSKIIDVSIKRSI